MTINTGARIAFTTLFIVLCLGGKPRAAELEVAESVIAGEIRALSKSIQQLSSQLAQQPGVSAQDANLRKLDIAITYLNFRSRRIEMAERDLQAARTSRNRLEDVLEQFKREEDNLSRSFDSSQQATIERAREELRFRRQAIKDRGSRLDEEIILLENRVMDMQSQIDSVESFVEKNLNF